MIQLVNIAKRYKVGSRFHTVLDDINISFTKGHNVGILGRNGAGKSTLLRIISGAELPTQGTVIREGRLSWPIGFAGGFHGSLTGRENLRFICRIYDANIVNVTSYVEDFSELGRYMDMPFNTYSSGMRAKLAFGLSMALEFDYYLIDEITAVGDASFKKKSQEEFENRKDRSTLIVVSHQESTIKKNCDNALVLHEGRLVPFEKVDEALRFYKKACLAFSKS